MTLSGIALPYMLTMAIPEVYGFRSFAWHRHQKSRPNWRRSRIQQKTVEFDVDANLDEIKDSKGGEFEGYGRCWVEVLKSCSQEQFHSFVQPFLLCRMYRLATVHSVTKQADGQKDRQNFLSVISFAFSGFSKYFSMVLRYGVWSLP